MSKARRLSSHVRTATYQRFNTVGSRSMKSAVTNNTAKVTAKQRRRIKKKGR